MLCKNCQHTNRVGAKFCDECGTKLENTCTACGHLLRLGAKFCDECGHRLQKKSNNTATTIDNTLHVSPTIATAPTKSKPKAAERRQLTCLFCDLVGSTALSEQLDAEDFRQVILDYQQIAEAVINQHGGYVAQYLGDGLLVYFGYPKGLENAPKAGIRAGLGILKALQQSNQQRVFKGLTEINIRIGIHSGLVVVDEHLALGDTVNITSRLEGLAPVNGLVISPQTLKLVQGWFAVKSLGKEVLRGIKEPMEIFQVVKESGVSSRMEIAVDRGLSPLVGREQEVALLLQSWEKSKVGNGQLLVLNGEAGIGKSRLVESIKEHIKQEPKAAKIVLRCSDYHINSPFYPLMDLLEKRILLLEKEEPAASKVDKLVQWFEFAGIDKKPNLPIFADLLAIPLSQEIREEFENKLIVSSGKRKRFMEGITASLLNYSIAQPLLFIIEDLHWMDSSTLEWLKQLIKKINAYPIFVLGTARPQFKAIWKPRDYTAQINLRRINTDRIESLCLHQTQGKTLPAKVLEQIKEKTDGVPLFVEELTRMIIESDLVIEKDSHYELNPTYATGFALTVPSTLQDSLIARLDRLSESREIIQIGAVLGRVFSFELLQAVVKKQEVILQQYLNQLVAADLLTQRGVGQKAQYIFKHALIKDTAYESLLRSRRQQLHQQVAAVLQAQFPSLIKNRPELLAQHLSEAGLKQQALLSWKKAGQKALANSSYFEAMQHFRRAIALLDTLEGAARNEQELSLLIPYNSAIMIAKGWSHPSIRKNANRMLQLCELQENTTMSIFGYYGLGAAAQLAANLEEALFYRIKGKVLAEQQEVSPFLPLQHSLMGEVQYFSGRFEESKENNIKALQLINPTHHQYIKKLGLEDVPVLSNSNLGYVLTIQGYIKQAHKIVEELQNRVQSETNIMVMWRCHTLKGWYHLYRKEWKAAQQTFNTILSLVVESGDMSPLLYSQFFKTATDFINGDISALKKSQFLIQQLIQLNILFGQTCSYGLLAEGCLINKMPVEGLACIDKALAVIPSTKEAFHLSRLYYLQGDLLLLKAAPVKAAQAYLNAIDIAQQQSAKWFELLAAKSLAGLWQSQGKMAEAYEVLHGVYSWFTEGFDAKDMVEAKVLLEELKHPIKKDG